jgi:enamine deaminase RidA (YjgF/YER057c/UK114 family)
MFMSSMLSPQANFERLNLVLPPPPAPKGVYKPLLVVDNLVYVSGHGPFREDGSLILGKAGAGVDKEAAKLAARQVGLTILSTIISNLGSLDAVRRVIKVLGMINATPDFEPHPYVINGCSELFAEVWGPDLGVGVRSAVGMGSLPENITVEIEAIFELA